MEKRKEKADLEQLLNSLIEKGWKPFGNCNRFDFRDLWLYYFANDNGRWSKYPLRMLVSKESWLWQFVCENGMVAEKSEWILYRYDDYKYRLTNCALKDESELEDFLLSNIKVDD